MMNLSIRLFLIIICSVLARADAKASPQAPDYLIIGKDTLPIFFLPLNRLDSLTSKNFKDNLKAEKEFGFSFNLWRGYQAYWQLIDKKLYLVGLKGYKNTDEILRKTFPDNYNNGRVFAYWFSGYLAIAKGKMLKWDGIFSRTYFKEEIYDFKNGELTKRNEVDNYTHLKNGISRLDINRKHVIDTIFSTIKGLNWKKLSDCDCDDIYRITVNERGKISKIESTDRNSDTPLTDDKDYKYCIKKMTNKLRNLQFDIVTWHGKPYNETYIFEILYTVDGKLENLTP